jgi:hypothetical protein
MEICDEGFVDDVRMRLSVWWSTKIGLGVMTVLFYVREWGGNFLPVASCSSCTVVIFDDRCHDNDVLVLH